MNLSLIVYEGSDTALVTLRIPGLLDQRSLCRKITNGLNTYFIQSRKKNQNLSKDYQACILLSDYLKLSEDKLQGYFNVCETCALIRS